MMIKNIKCTIIALITCLLGSTAVAQQADLNLDHLATLQKAYEHVLAQEYEEAETLYKGLQSEKDVKADIQHAAVEGQSLVVLLELNARIEEAKGDKVKARLLRFPRKTAVNLLKKASAKNPSDALLYMYALAKEDKEISAKTFVNMELAKEYERLGEKPTEVVAEPESEPARNLTSSVSVNGVKITGAKATSLRNVKFIANNIVNVRKGPGTSYPQIAQLTNKQEVIVVESIRLSNGQVWYKLKGDNRIGYAAARFFIRAATKSTSAKKSSQAPRPATNVKSGNRACSGKHVSVFITKRNADVKYKPNGKAVIFKYVRQTTVKVYGTVAGHAIIRVASNGKFICGYIKK